MILFLSIIASSLVSSLQTERSIFITVDMTTDIIALVTSSLRAINAIFPVSLCHYSNINSLHQSCICCSLPSPPPPTPVMTTPFLSEQRSGTFLTGDVLFLTYLYQVSNHRLTSMHVSTIWLSDPFWQPSRRFPKTACTSAQFFFCLSVCLFRLACFFISLSLYYSFAFHHFYLPFFVLLPQSTLNL